MARYTKGSRSDALSIALTSKCFMCSFNAQLLALFKVAEAVRLAGGGAPPLDVFTLLAFPVLILFAKIIMAT